MSLLCQTRQLSPLVSSDIVSLSLVHGLLSIPASNGNEFSRQGDLHKGMVGPATEHFLFLNEGSVSLIELKQLLPLLASTNIDFAIQLALEDGAEVAEGVLHVRDRERLRGKVLQIVHYDLFLIRNKDSDSIFL